MRSCIQKNRSLKKNDMAEARRDRNREFPEKTSTDDGIPIRTLFIGNLSRKTTEEDLIKIFSAYGSVKRCIVTFSFTSPPLGFVTFETTEDALKARQATFWRDKKRAIRLDGRILKVEVAHDQEFSCSSSDNDNEFIYDGWSSD